MQLAVMLVGAGAVYGGIRADLRELHRHISRIEDAAHAAHKRIDRCVYGRRGYDKEEGEDHDE